MHQLQNHSEIVTATPRQLKTLTEGEQWDWVSQRYEALPDDVTKVQVGEFVVDRRQLPLFGRAALACMAGQLSLELTHLTNGEKIPARMRCGMKRCLRCGQSEYQKLRNNLKIAFNDWGSEDAVVVVFTLHKRRDLWNKKKKDAESYELLQQKFASTHQWIERNFGVTAYFSLPERHLTGTEDGGSAHLNVVFISKELADAVRATPKTGDRSADIFPLWFQKAAKRQGWGRSSIETMRDNPGGLAAYLAKIHEGQTVPGMAGELTKKSQRVGIAAPLGTKLVRSSRNFFRAVPRKMKEWTGVLRRWSYEDALQLQEWKANTGASLEEVDAGMQAEHQCEAPTASAVVREDDAVQPLASLQLGWRTALLALGGSGLLTNTGNASAPSKAVKEVFVHPSPALTRQMMEKKELSRWKTRVPTGLAWC